MPASKASPQPVVSTTSTSIAGNVGQRRRRPGDQAAVRAQRHCHAAGARVPARRRRPLEVSAAGEGQKLIAVRPEPVGPGERAADAARSHARCRGAARRRRPGRRRSAPPRRQRARSSADRPASASGPPSRTASQSASRGQVEVGELQQPRGARHVQRRPLAVRPDRQDRRGRLGAGLADQPARCRCRRRQRGQEQDLGQQVSADGAERAVTLAPSFARSTPVPAAVPAAVARISVSRALPWPAGMASTGPPEHVQDVRSDDRDPAAGRRWPGCRVRG